MFHHFTINGIWLMLFLHELKQVMVLVKQLGFINRNVSLKHILLTWFNIFHLLVYKGRNLVKVTLP